LKAAIHAAESAVHHQHDAALHLLLLLLSSKAASRTSRILKAARKHQYQLQMNPQLLSLQFRAAHTRSSLPASWARSKANIHSSTIMSRQIDPKTTIQVEYCYSDVSHVMCKVGDR
jgi:hypothetical protein